MSVSPRRRELQYLGMHDTCGVHVETDFETTGRQGEMIPEATPERDRGRQMTPRERRIDEELRRLAPHLAGLFRQGLEYIERVHEPGGIYMFSHAGRELSAAVIRLLAGEGEPLTHEEAEHVPTDEGHRRKIAPALGLAVQHPSVTTWMRTHKALQETAHYRAKAPSADTIQRTIEAFWSLTDILVGRIGLYFDARRELDVLLATTSPTPADIDRLRALALRPQLRLAFFHQLRHVGWLEPLKGIGLFREAPDIRVDPETGESQALPWPEGEYLASIAPAMPEQVVEVLLDVPDGIRNPIVWRSVADTALRLPVADAARLAPKLSQAVAQADHPMVSRAVFAVAEHLAAGGEGCAIDLLRALVAVAPGDQAGPFRATPTGQVAVLPRMRHTARPGDFLHLVEEIAALRPREIVPELSNRLNDMLRIEYGDPSGLEPPVPDYSRAWRGSIDEEVGRSQIAMMAAAVLHAARIAAAHPDPGPTRVLQRLSRSPWNIFRRLRLAFLADMPVFDQAALDAAIGDLALLDVQPVQPEYRQLIRARFRDASPEVREMVAQHILRGPDESTLERVVGVPGPESANDDAAVRFREHWQRHRLRLFADAPPPELEARARELGTTGEELTGYERDMDERGFAVQVGTRGGPPSPLSLEELRAMSTDELVEYLKTFNTEAGWNAPTPAALASVLAQGVQEDSARAAPLLGRIAAEGVDPTYIRGVLEGLVATVKTHQQIPWPESLGLVADIVSRPPEPAPEGSPAQYFDRSDPGLTWARTTAADLLSDCANSNLVPSEHREDLWAAVEALVRADATWESGPAAAASMDDVLHLDINRLGGKAVEALLDVAIYDYRLWENAGRKEEWGGRERLRPLLEMILERSAGEAAVAARSALGRYMPQIVFLDLSWLEANWEPLFDKAVEAPLQNPVFASYLAQEPVYDQAFEVLRPLYQEAVEETARETNHWTAGEESFRPGRHLLSHLFAAYQAGWLEIDRDAEFLDQAFANAHPEDTAHVWWGVYREWTDSEGPIPQSLLRGAVDLWDWRLTRLEGAKATERRRREAEGLGWLAMAEGIPDEATLPLLLRTVRLSDGGVPIVGAVWERLGRMAVLNARTATEIAALVVRAELAGEFPHFNVEEVAPVLRTGLHSGDAEAREFAERTIHALGDRGFEQFGELLR